MQALLWILLLAQTQGGVISGRIVSADGSLEAQNSPSDPTGLLLSERS